MMASLKRRLLPTAVKRRPSPPPPPDISSLDDNLIYEILTRLSNPRSVFRCKSVCKRWNSLISAPYFRPKFLRHLATRPSASSSNEFPLLCPESQQETFEFLPIPADLRGQFRILASYDDLILVGTMTPPNDTVGRWFFVCNPLTKQWVTLPPAPLAWRREDLQPSERIMVGFACQPCYTYSDSKHQGLIDPQFKFRILLVYESFGYLCLERFCSESSEWGVRHCELGEWQATSFNHITLPSSNDGMMYWWNDNKSGLVCYDPFQPNGLLMAFNYSDLCSNYHRRRVDVGVSNGRLHIILGSVDDGFDVWRLEELYYKPGVLVDQAKMKSVKVKFNLKKIVRSKDSTRGLIMMMMMKSMEVKGVLGMHPSNPDIVYLASGNVGYDAVSCNLRSGELEILGEYSQDSSMFSWSMFQLKIPFWPTPVPLPCNYETVTFDEDGGGSHSIVAHSSMLVMSGEESESSLPVQLFDSSSSDEASRVEEEAGGGIVVVGDHHEELNLSPPEQAKWKGNMDGGGAMVAEEISSGSSAGVKRILMFYLIGAIFLKMAG